MGVVKLYGFVRVNEINLILYVFVETYYFNINFEGGRRTERRRERERDGCLLYFFSLIVFSLSLFANVAAFETIVIEIVFIPFILLTTFAQ